MSRLRSRRRPRRPRILRPRMPRIPPAQLFPDLLVGGVPEVAQVAGGLHGAAVGCEQLERHRLSLGPEARRFGQAEELLQLDRGEDGAVLLVAQPGCPPAWNRERLGREAIETA